MMLPASRWEVIRLASSPCEWVSRPTVGSSSNHTGRGASASRARPKPPLLARRQALGLKAAQRTQVHGVKGGVNVAAAEEAGPERQVLLNGEVQLDGVLVGDEMHLGSEFAIIGTGEGKLAGCGLGQSGNQPQQ